MNKEQKIAHLRALADALECGRKIMFQGHETKPASLDRDCTPFLNEKIWDYIPAPKPWEGHIIFDPNDHDRFTTVRNREEADRYIKEVLVTNISWKVIRVVLESA